ncbi:hypothetical protein I4U23_021903 [Adineta vaga]|nr:hypothetical protein I4U23_021903 [Adineta vaga]
MLSNINEHSHKIVCSLDTNEKLQSVRKMMHLISTSHYVILQKDLWQNLHDFETKNDTWSMKISKSIARDHCTCQTITPSKHSIEQRQKMIHRQMTTSGMELQEHFLDLLTWTQQCSPPIDIHQITEMMDKCVENGLRRLKDKFNYKKTMLQNNYNDHEAITKFYSLHPSEEQIYLAKKIWQSVAAQLKVKERQEILRKRISLRRLPSSVDRSVDQAVDNIREMLESSVINDDERANLTSQCSKTITQFKCDVMVLTLATMENIIRGHVKEAAELKQKFLSDHSHRSQLTIKELYEAIENRIETMRIRLNIQSNLTPSQMAMFIKGLQYVIPCQSRFRHRTNKQIIQEQYEMLLNTVTNCLRDNCMSASDKRAQEAFSELKKFHHLFIIEGVVYSQIFMTGSKMTHLGWTRVK